MEKVEFKLTMDIAEDSKHPHWEEILKTYIEEAVTEYVACQSEEHPDPLVEIVNVSAIQITVSKIKWGIEIDGVQQWCEFFDEGQARAMAVRLEEKEGIQPELIDVYPIEQIKEVK